jgi:hypothetical protein
MEVKLPGGSDDQAWWANLLNGDTDPARPGSYPMTCGIHCCRLLWIRTPRYPKAIWSPDPDLHAGAAEHEEQSHHGEADHHELNTDSDSLADSD